MSTSLPVKCHLPLITTRIEFQFNVLPPPPQITPRRDLGAFIRRQARRPNPYTRFNREEITTHRAESPLTEIPDSENGSDIEEATFSHKIPKPAGEAGKRNSGGYSLQVAMGWEDEEFAKFTASQDFHILKKPQNYRLNRNISTMKLEKSSISRFVTVSKSVKTWTQSSNQYGFEPCFRCFSYPYNPDSATV